MPSQRIPFLAGGTKGRDHFQFRTASLDGDSFNDSSANSVPRRPPGDGSTFNPPYGDIGFPSPTFDLDKALKWLWKVREWSFSGSFANILGPTVTLPGVSHSPMVFGIPRGSGSVSNALTLHQKTGPTGIHAYSGAVGVQPECEQERELLDSFKDAGGNVIFTRGNFGAVVDRPSSAYHPFNDDDTGQLVTESATAVWNLGVNGGADTDEAFILGGPYAGDYVIRTASIVPGDCTVEYLVAIKRWDPQAPNTKNGQWNSPLQNDIIWKGPGDDGRFLIPVRFYVNLRMPYHLYMRDDIYTDNPASGGTFITSIVFHDEDVDGSVPVNFFPAGGPFIFTLDSDTHAFRWGQDPAATASLELEPTAFWPFKNRLGQPVYDEGSGAQVNDPFA